MPPGGLVSASSMHAVVKKHIMPGVCAKDLHGCGVPEPGIGWVFQAEGKFQVKAQADDLRGGPIVVIGRRDLFLLPRCQMGHAIRPALIPKRAWARTDQARNSFFAGTRGGTTGRRKVYAYDTLGFDGDEKSSDGSHRSPLISGHFGWIGWINCGCLLSSSRNHPQLNNACVTS